MVRAGPAMSAASTATGMDDERPRHRPSPTKTERALGVETVIVPDRGLWAVDIVVVFNDGVVRRRIQTYRSEKLAQISAGYIKRGAEREIGGGPPNG
jgi:hypothetical protein